MSLKKSDKIIAIIGVLILVIAGAAIVIYAINYEETEDEPTPEKELPAFNVTCELKSEPVTPDNTDFIVNDKLLNDKIYVGKVSISGENIASVDFFVDFKDNKPLFKDVLTITVKDQDGKEVGSKSITGSGNVTIPVNEGQMIPIEVIEANTTEEARQTLEQILEENYAFTEKTYTIEIKINQKLIELLGEDSFTLEITKNYYEYIVEEQEQI